MLNGLQIRARQAEWAFRQVDFLVFSDNRNTRSVIANMTFSEKGENELIEPSFSLDKTAVQVLMDDLYAAGFRPSENKYTDEAFKAMANHLGDMRKIVSKQLDVELK